MCETPWFGRAHRVAEPRQEPNRDRKGAEQKRALAWLATGVVLALFLAMGCNLGAPADTDGVGGVVPLGPPSVGGGGGGTADQIDDGEPPPDDADAGDATDSQEDVGPADDGGGGDDTSPGDSSDVPGDESDDDVGVEDNPFSIDACDGVEGRPFFTPTGSLSFPDNVFIWTVDGVQTGGSYACSGLSLTGFGLEGEVFTGSYDPLEDVVIWEGAVYRPRER